MGVRTAPLRRVGVLAIAAILLAGCGGTTGTSSPSASNWQGSPIPSRHMGPVVVRWMVWSNYGGAAAPPWQKWVKDYNATQDKIYVNVELVPASSALDILKKEIAIGDAPDIVGPFGFRQRNGFGGAFMDLAPLVESHHVDTSQWAPELLEFMSQGNDGLVGLPYLMYPAFMFYNKDLFKASGLPGLPHRVGETYMGKTWDWNALAEIGMKLTLDVKGHHPGDPGFLPEQIEQWGLDFQWWDGRRMASAFGGGSLVAADGKTAQIPSAWADAWRWYYDAIWKYHFAPHASYLAWMDYGTSVATGKIAMNGANAWSINSYGAAGKARFKNWDLAVMPSWKGQTSGPLDMDSFSIVKGSVHPDAAFDVILALMGDASLREWYGGMPARTADQAAYFAAFDRTLEAVFPGNKVDWSVLQEMARYPSTPSHEADLPNAWNAINVYGAFYTHLQSSQGLDMDRELAKLQADLQKAFDAPPSPSPR